jgi:hypothetical protein
MPLQWYRRIVVSLFNGVLAYHVGRACFVADAKGDLAATAVAASAVLDGDVHRGPEIGGVAIVENGGSEAAP